MNTQEAVQRANAILLAARVDPSQAPNDFLEFARLVADAAKSLGPTQRQALGFDFAGWAMAWRKLFDDFTEIVRRDPMAIYRPANKACQEFHSSQAYVRYFMSGNRCGKSQSGFAEHYFVTTGQHQWRQFIRPPVSTFVIGVDYKHYSKGVFGAKLFTGETDNPLAPMFPEGGKWLHHYNEREHVGYIACPSCAEAGKAQTCRHPKSTIQLFSDEGSWEQLQGAQYVLGHFDEHVDEGFFTEARQRTKTVKTACLIVTGSPLLGPEMWEVRRLYNRWLGGMPGNLYDPENPNSGPFVTVHQIDQFAAGLVPHDKIRADMVDLDEFEIESRIYGRPSPLAKNPVFDRKKLVQMRETCRSPERLDLAPAEGLNLDSQELGRWLANLGPNSNFQIVENELSPLRIWERPILGETYLLSADVAAGLRDGDASCGSVLKLGLAGTRPTLELVAQWHGWINPHDYAGELLKLAIWYGSALLVVELTGGLGRSTMLKLKQDYSYWNIYREPSRPEEAIFHLDPRLGVETSASSKPHMIATLQSFIKEGRIGIPCQATIQELTAYEQQSVGAGGTALLSPRFGGAKGSHDDRVMSLAIGAAVAIGSPQLTSLVQFRDNGSAKRLEPKNMTEVQREIYDLATQNKINEDDL